MFEVLEFVKNKDFKDKIIPIITEESKIFDANGKINYLKHWTKKKNELKSALDGIPVEKTIPIIQKIKEYDNVEAQIIDFLDIIGDMNNIVISNNSFTDINFDTIKNYINIGNIIPNKYIINIRMCDNSKVQTSDILSFLREKFSELEVVYLKDKVISLKLNSYISIDDLFEIINNNFTINVIEKLKLFNYEDAYYIIAKRKISEYNSKAIMWWKPMDDGYTDNLKNAGFYDLEHINSFKKQWFYSDQLAIKCSIVDKLGISVFPLNSSYSEVLVADKKNIIGEILYEGEIYF